MDTNPPEEQAPRNQDTYPTERALGKRPKGRPMLSSANVRPRFFSTFGTDRYQALKSMQQRNVWLRNIGASNPHISQ